MCTKRHKMHLRASVFMTSMSRACCPAGPGGQTHPAVCQPLIESVHGINDADVVLAPLLTEIDTTSYCGASLAALTKYLVSRALRK